MSFLLDDIKSWPWSKIESDYARTFFKTGRFTLECQIYSLFLDSTKETALYCEPLRWLMNKRVGTNWEGYKNRARAVQANVPCSMDEVLSNPKVNPLLKKKFLWNLSDLNVPKQNK